MAIDIQQRKDGLVIRVRAQAGARADEIRGEQGGALKVAVTQAAEKGKANRAILELLANVLQVRKAQLELIAGHSSNQKQVLVRDISTQQLAAQLSEILQR